MAHLFESGFFTRQEAWHGLGTVLQDPPRSYVEALEQSGLDWSVEKVRMDANGVETPFTALVRSSDNSILGQCKDNYYILQNKEAMKWCQPLVETDLWSFETGGSLQDGKWCWVLLKQDEDEIVPNDTLKRFLLLTWNHTGKAASAILPTTIRVVCNNTLQAALFGANGQGDRIKHVSSMPWELGKIQSFYKAMSAEFQREHEVFDRLLNVHWEDTKLEEYVDSLFPILDINIPSKAKTISERVNSTVKEMVVAGKASGAEELGIKNTAYGAFQAVSEFNEHFAGGARVKDRGLYMLNGQGLTANREALDTAISMAGVN